MLDLIQLGCIRWPTASRGATTPPGAGSRRGRTVVGSWRRRTSCSWTRATAARRSPRSPRPRGWPWRRSTPPSATSARCCTARGTSRSAATSRTCISSTGPRCAPCSPNPTSRPDSRGSPPSTRRSCDGRPGCAWPCRAPPVPTRRLRHSWRRSTTRGSRRWGCTLGPPRRPAGWPSPEEECRDVLFATTDGSLWHNLVERRGWSDERYAAWLGRLWVAMLVDPTDEPADA